ncbi:MAG: TMEM175 family protein [Candidatus Acidiferrales bacterium]
MKAVNLLRIISGTCRQCGLVAARAGIEMRLSYNDIAEKSVERLAALSDGIFAVAMTLLVLDLRVPVTDAIHSEHELWSALAALGP